MSLTSFRATLSRIEKMERCVGNAPTTSGWKPDMYLSTPTALKKKTARDLIPAAILDNRVANMNT